ncbi:unnamed protein product [Boreogadus saida]
MLLFNCTFLSFSSSLYLFSPFFSSYILFTLLSSYLLFSHVLSPILSSLLLSPPFSSLLGTESYLETHVSTSGKISNLVSNEENSLLFSQKHCGQNPLFI